jgi:hypothetical protein
VLKASRSTFELAAAGLQYSRDPVHGEGISPYSLASPSNTSDSADEIDPQLKPHPARLAVVENHYSPHRDMSRFLASSRN